MTADLVGFSSHLRTDEDEVLRLLTESYYRLADQRVSEQGGILFRKEGDAVWASFPSALGAVRAAIALQEDMMLRNLAELSGLTLSLRVGIHLGDVTITGDGDHLGHALSVTKRLETACPEGSILVSAPVHVQVADRELGFRFRSLGEIDLKGVGRYEAWEGTLSPERLAELLIQTGTQRTGQAGLRLLVLADLSTLLGSWKDRITWERSAVAAFRKAGAEFHRSREDQVAMVLPPDPALRRLLSDRSLAGPRMVVTVGDVATGLDEQGDLASLSGTMVEDACDALGSTGLETDVVLVTGPAARALGARPESDLQPAGRVANRRRTPLYRLRSTGSDPIVMQEEHAPRSLGVPVRSPVPSIMDILVGVRRERRDLGEHPRLRDLWLRMVAAVPRLETGCPLLSGRTESILASEPLAELGVAAGLLASASGARIPPRILVVGRLGDGTQVAPLDPMDMAWIEELVDRFRPGAVLGPSGLSSLVPSRIETVEADRLEDLEPWLRRSGHSLRVASLAGAAQDGQLAVVVAGPLGGPEEGASWTRWLAATTGRPPVDRDPLVAAEEAEDLIGREALEQAFLRWSGERREPILVRQILGVGPSMVVTTFPDLRLSRITLPPGDATELLALGGDAQDPRGMVLTEADLDRLLERSLPRVDEWRRQLAGRSLLVMGTHQGARFLWPFLRQMTGMGSDRAPVAVFLATWSHDPGADGWWERRGVQVLDHSPPELLDEVFVRKAAGAASIRRIEIDREAALPRSAWPGSRAFEAGDRLLFFGRDREIQLLRTRLEEAPWVAIRGPAGSGRTSLLRAGLLPSLRSDGRRLVAYLDFSDEGGMGDELLESILQEGKARGAILAIEGLGARLSGLDEVSARTLLLPLASAVSEGARLLVSLRSDEVREYEALATSLPGSGEPPPVLQLLDLTDEQARAAIAGPASLYGIELEPGLDERIAADLDERGVDPGLLQVVLGALDRARKPDQVSLSRRDLSAQGDVRGILSQHLVTTLEDLGRDERELARTLLDRLVSVEEGAPRDAEAMATGLEEPPSLVASVLSRLVAARILRPRRRGGSDEFQVRHRLFREEILGWDTEANLSLHHAQATLRSAHHNWTHYQVLPGAELLDVIRTEHRRLAVTEAERSLLLRSSAFHSRPLGEWIPGGRAASDLASRLAALAEDAGLPDEARRNVLESMCILPLGSEASRVALATAERVAHPGLVARLAAGPLATERPAFLEAVRRRMHRRFFGPQRMIHVPAGPALLGSRPEERETRMAGMRLDLRPRIASERDLTEVAVEEFWIDRLLTTHADYQELEPGHVHRYPPEESRHPVVYVSWEAAVRYATWLGKALPTEEQWEKAARGVDGRLYPWGDEWDPTRLESAESGRRRTSPVGSFPEGASPYGCLDMAGNVWEWTASAWSPDGPFRVQKGGSAVSYEPFQRCAARFEGYPDFILQYVGFRTVCTALPPMED